MSEALNIGNLENFFDEDVADDLSPEHLEMLRIQFKRMKSLLRIMHERIGSFTGSIGDFNNFGY